MTAKGHRVMLGDMWNDKPKLLNFHAFNLSIGLVHSTDQTNVTIPDTNSNVN